MSELATRLLIEPNARVLLLNAPIGYAKKLAPLPDGVTISDRRSEDASDVAIVFVRDLFELKRFKNSFAALADDAVLWVCIPKSKTDLNRDALLAELEKDELTGDSPIEFDETWSCTRFRVPEDEED